MKNFIYQSVLAMTVCSFALQNTSAQLIIWSEEIAFDWFRLEALSKTIFIDGFEVAQK